MFGYDIFISYSSADREWAMCLNERLTAPGRKLRTFFDHQSLRVGDNWAAQITAGLDTSQHLIVLWSSQAKKSDWVIHEITAFNLLAQPRVNPERRLIFVNLEGANEVYRDLQQVVLPSLQIAYADNGSEATEVWNEIMVEVDKGLDPNTRPLPIPVVVLTLTRDDLDRLPPKRREWIQNDYRISLARLALQYGPTRADWRPVGGLHAISTLLERTRTEINMAIPGRHVTWREPEIDFWTDMNVAKLFINNEFLRGELSLLVIDPVAIYEQEAFQRLVCFQECFTRPNTVIATLSPFAVPRRITGLKSALQSRGTPYFDDYFQPAVPPKRPLLAQCIWNANDADDIRRHLLVAAGGLAAETSPPPISTFVRHGAPR